MEKHFKGKQHLSESVLNIRRWVLCLSNYEKCSDDYVEDSAGKKWLKSLGIMKDVNRFA